jgi:hypothetical protein
LKKTVGRNETDKQSLTSLNSTYYEITPKMRGFAITIFTLMALIVEAQPSDSLIIFSGYILDTDSLPIENALLVNYRTIHGNTTNEKGFFKICLQKGDSLMINHLSYERRIIKANDKPSLSNCYFLKFSPYEMKTIDVNYRNIEMENFHRNMKLINYQMRMNTPTYRTNTERNAYAPPAAGNQTVGINLFEVIRYIKTKKYRNSIEENK